MKITVAYLPEDEQEAAAALVALRRLHPDAKLRKSDRHPPYQHIYLTTKRAEIRIKPGETVDFPQVRW